MRPLSSVARRALFAQETDQVFLLLLTIAHPSLTASIRCVDNTEDIVSRGETYIAFPFEITLPDERDETPPRMRLRIDNVDRSIVQAVRTIQSPPTITLEVVLAASPSTIEARFDGFQLRQTTYDALTVEGDLEAEAVLSEPFPAGSFIPSDFPGLF